MGVIDHSDATNAIYDINSSAYWEPKSLQQEFYRIFDICVGCRLCWNLCPSFPALFNTIDHQADEKRRQAEIEGRVGAKIERVEFLDLPEGEHAVAASAEVEFVGAVTEMADSELWRVVDLCYQCKLCDPICPYTPDKDHHFQLDFPRLMLRAQAIRTKKRGKKMNDVFLSATDVTGKLGTLMAPVTNFMNRLGPARWMMEKVMGISRHRELPRFYAITFKKWFAKRASHQPGNNGKVALFITCYTNANDPGVGRAAVEVLEHNGIEVQVPEQQCCGAPHLSPGDFSAFKKQAQPNIDSLATWVDNGYQIVVTGPPTCSMTLRQDYTYASNGDPAQSEKIAKVAANTVDISQYLMQLHKAGKFNTDFVHELGEINYHLSCHLKAQKIGYKSRDLLRLVPGTKVNLIDQCSGMDGGWGMKAEFFDDSMKVASKLVNKLNRKPAEHTCSDCTLAGLQIKQASAGNLASKHPIILIHHAYGLDETTELSN